MWDLINTMTLFKDFFRKRYSKNIAYWTIAIILSFIFLFFTGESTIRIYLLFHHPKIIMDEYLGWTVPPETSFTLYRKDSEGKKYTINFTSKEHGFRVFDDINSEKIKLFVIGDSFTHALDILEGNTYYDLLKTQLDVEVFAFGCIGYSTTQEYLLLKQYIDVIKPDVILWQFTSNDFINNDFDLEFQSKRNNNGLRRPYLHDDHSIKYQTPKRFPHVRNYINSYSRFAYFVTSRIDQLSASHIELELEIEKQGSQHPGFKTAWSRTFETMKLVKSCSDGSLIVAFSVDDTFPFYQELQHICELTDITFVDGIPQKITRAEKNGINTRASDGAHWNETGHRICGEALSSSLEEIINDTIHQDIYD